MDDSFLNQDRRTTRSRVLLHAEVDVAGSVLPVRLRDISVGGALIEGEHLPAVGSCVILRRNELQVNGSIVWSNGRHAGLAFRAPIEPEEVLRTIRPPQPKPTPNFRRPGLREHQLSPQEEMLVKMMADGVINLTRR